MSKTAQSGPVGRSIPRLEGRAKVTGRAEYVHNLRLPGMLYGKIFRSTVAHGRIKRIDITAARAVPGVHRVVTGEDIRAVIPDPYYGPAFHDQPILALDKVRHVGEPVAVVLASDPHVAEEAASRIVVEYEEMPAVFDEVEAMTSNAMVHDVLKPAGTFPDLKHLQGKKNTNIALDYHLRRGDAAAAFGKADRVFEHTFRTQQVLHVPLEPFVSAAVPGDGTLTIHTASQSPSFVRIEIARLLGWPENKVRVKVPYLGGGFGAKLYIKLEALVAALALLARRPVKISLTMEEQFYHAHQARGDVSHQERRDEGRARHRAGVRGLVERRCLRGHRPAHYAEIRLYRAGAVRHRERAHRLVRALHEPATCRRASRLRHSAARVGVRRPHRHDRARAETRPAGIPAQEYPPRWPPAGDRHAS